MNETTTELVPIEVQDEIQAAKRVKAKKASREELAKQINAAYAAYMQSIPEIYALELTMENRRIVLGTYLHEAKKQIGHGKFLKWLKENCELIPEREAQRYMKFAGAAKYQVLKDVHDKRAYDKVLVAMGLKEPAQGQGAQQLHDYNFYAVFTKTCMSAAQKFKEVFEHQPLEDIGAEIAAEMKRKLQPFVDLYERLPE